MKKKTILIAIWIMLIVGISLPTLSYYAKFQLSGLGFLLVPFIAAIEHPGKTSNRYGWATLVLLLAYLALPARLILLFATYTTLFFIIEKRLGQLNWLAPILAMVSSPLAYYFFELFSFPIRLQLTNWATELLQFFGYSCMAQGNMINCNGDLFSVDPVCMGLNMVVTAFLAAIILMRFYDFQKKKFWALKGIGAVLLITFLMVILANLIRIFLLILLKAGPEHFLHEWIGLACMALLVFLPLYGLLEKFGEYAFLFNKVRRNESTPSTFTFETSRDESAWSAFTSSNSQLLPALLTIFLLFGHWTYHGRSTEFLNKSTEKITLPNYEKDVFTFENRIQVLRFISDDAIVYIKNQHPLRLTNHNPAICWRGSGYELKNENLLEVGNHYVHTAILEREGEQLYTAWWFDNGQHKTSSNLFWRWEALHTQQPWRMINVTSDEFSKMYKEVGHLLKMEHY